MKAENKYTLFKNFMHNELGISKEDIREWIKLSIAEEVEKIVKQTYEKCDIEDMIQRALTNRDYYWNGNRELKETVINKVAMTIGKEIVKEWKTKNE